MSQAVAPSPAGRSLPAAPDAHHHLEPPAMTPHADAQGAKIGMWLFLFTEVLLFMGVFLAYAVYRWMYAVDFHYAAKELNTFMGAMNTIILLTSSLTVVLAIGALQRGNKRLCVWMIGLTLVFGLWFLVNKYFEWGAKFEHHLYPGSDVLTARPMGQQIYFALYYLATGLHALHVIIGMGALTFALIHVLKNPVKRLQITPWEIRHVSGSRLALVGEGAQDVWAGEPLDETVKSVRIVIQYDDSRSDQISGSDFSKLENAGLYWHLVDIIWIFLFPLMYLIT
ncbi:MAG: cytochrome c oxidase subunit 3 family protein [Candidatus Sumerlaeia bacterium]